MPGKQLTLITVYAAIATYLPRAPPFKIMADAHICCELLGTRDMEVKSVIALSLHHNV